MKERQARQRGETERRWWWRAARLLLVVAAVSSGALGAMLLPDAPLVGGGLVVVATLCAAARNWLGRRRQRRPEAVAPRARRRLPLAGVLALVAIAGLLSWWWVHPELRVRFQLDVLGASTLAEETLAGITDPQRKLQAEVDVRLGGDERMGRFLNELADWPWGRCMPARAELVLPEGEDLLDVFVFRPPSLAEQRWDAWAAYELVYRQVLRSGRGRSMMFLQEWKSGIPARFEQDHVDLSIPPDHHVSAPNVLAEASLEIVDGWLREQLAASVIDPDYLEGHHRRERALAYRLGHAGWRLATEGHATGAIVCVFCGEIRGPAVGVTEHPDGSLTWQDDEGRDRHVPPVWWMPPTWIPPTSRPTMPHPEPPLFQEGR